MDINLILDVGIILLAASVGTAFIEFIKLPRITFYIIIGILIGPSFFNLISPKLIDYSDLFTNIALSFIAFELGKKFSFERLKLIGKDIFCITSVQIVVTFCIVSLALYMTVKISIPIALIYGAIACATAPAATILVTKEYKAKGPFTDTLLGTVALDDGMGIIMFALFFSIAQSIVGGEAIESHPVLTGLSHAFREIFGAIFLGVVLGWLLSHLPKIIKKHANTMIYTLGTIIFATGLCLHFELSVLLANMSLGITVENLSSSNVKFFEVVEKIESPFYVLFFVLAGAHLKVDMISNLSLVGFLYLVFRVFGKLTGAYLGAKIIHAKENVKKYLGLAMLPQAGVALGFALIVKSSFPKTGGEEVFFVITATTVLFEIAGPVLTKLSLKKAGEIKT